jgi:hypothetical protein
VKNRINLNCDFVNRFNVIWVVQSLYTKIFRFPFPLNQWLSCAIPAREEGRTRRHERWARDAVDAKVSRALMKSQGGLNLVSDLPARKTSGTIADGEVVWSWHPLLMPSRRRFWSARPGPAKP